MTGHTPGPWTVPEHYSLFQVWADGALVADTFTMNWHAEECEANARLIAAAPEMYETGKALLETLGFPGGGWDMDLPGAAEVMAFFDALAKAEGWTP